jgi:hypothetical protein
MLRLCGILATLLLGTCDRASGAFLDPRYHQRLEDLQVRQAPVPTICDTYTTTVLVVLGSQSTPTTTATPGTLPPFGTPIILGVQGQGATARRLRLRQNGPSLGPNSGFVGTAGNPNPASCVDAAQFILGGGRLSGPAGLVSVNVGVDSLDFTGAVGGSITTTFTDAGGVLAWTNSEFDGGAAGFCQLANGRVLAIFDAGGVAEPCQPVTLTIFAANQCQDGQLVPSTSSSTTSSSQSSTTSDATATTSTGTGASTGSSSSTGGSSGTGASSTSDLPATTDTSVTSGSPSSTDSSATTGTTGSSDTTNSPSTTTDGSGATNSPTTTDPSATSGSPTTTGQPGIDVSVGIPPLIDASVDVNLPGATGLPGVDASVGVGLPGSTGGAGVDATVGLDLPGATGQPGLDASVGVGLPGSTGRTGIDATLGLDLPVSTGQAGLGLSVGVGQPTSTGQAGPDATVGPTPPTSTGQGGLGVDVNLNPVLSATIRVL